MRTRTSTEAVSMRSTEPTFEAMVSMRDGARLATDVYLPAAPHGGRRPAVVIRTPYGKRGILDAVAQTAAVLVEEGLAVVAQDVRGKFASEGSAAPFTQEFDDGSACVEWIAAQPWSDRRVLAVGDSYAGFTAWCVAASRHPAVRGAVVRVTTSDIAEEWMYRQGIFRLQMNAGWTTFAFGGREHPPLPSRDPDWRTRPLAGLDFGDLDTDLLRFVRTTPAASRTWGKLGLGADGVASSRVGVPVLHSGGWWDLLMRGQIRDWQRVASRAPGQVLVMGGTDHLGNHFADGQAPEAPVGGTTVRDAEQLVTWARTVLDRGKAPTTAAHWELVHGGWHMSRTWPPPEAETTVLYFADGASAHQGPEGGALAARPDVIPRIVTWTHDPDDLVPSLEQFIWGTLANYPDERDAQIRDDVLTFSSTATREPLDIAGRVRVRAVLEPSTPQVHLMATLSDVYPDGGAARIAEGAAVLARSAGAQRVDVDLGHLGYRIRPGHRLRVALSGSAFPRYLWHVGGDGDPWYATGGRPVELNLRLGHDSALEIDTLRGPERPAPVP